MNNSLAGRGSNPIIDAINDSLSKPNLHPRARVVLEKRLKHHLGKVGKSRGYASRNNLQAAQRKSAKERAAKAEKKLLGVMPIILKLREEKLTYKQIAEHLQSVGTTNLRGTPYSESSICSMVLRNAAEKQT